MLIDAPEIVKIEAAIIPMDKETSNRALEVASDLRRTGFSAEIFSRGNMKKRFARADQVGAAVAIIIGSEELETGKLQLKNLATGEQAAVDLEDIPDKLWDLRFEDDLYNVENMLTDLEEDVANAGDAD